MKTAYRFAAVLLVSSSLLHGQTPPASPAPASESSEETIKLPSFSVTGTAADPYRATEVTSISRISGSILDAPLSVNVVPRELMNDLGASVSYDVTRYFAGVSGGRGAGVGGIMDRQNFRGFESFSKTIDNFSSFLLPTGSGFQANFDPAFIDRSELVMGPDTILSPTGSPGGSINIITKSPQFTEANEISGQVGNYAAQKVTLDSTGPVPFGTGHSDKLAYRVITSYQDTKTYVPGKVKQFNGSVQFAYKFSDTSKLTFKWFGQDWNAYGAQTNPNNNGEIIGITSGVINGATLDSKALTGFRRAGWNGSTRWSNRHDRTNIASLEYTTTIADRVSMRLAAEQIYDEFTQDVGYPNVNPSDVWDLQGNVIGIKDATFKNPLGQTFTTSSNPASVTELAQIVHQVNYDEQLQNDYAANFRTNGITIQPIVGWAYQQGSQPTNKNRQDKNDMPNNIGSMPNANLFASDYYSPPHPSLAQYDSSYSEQIEHSDLWQIYTVNKVGFIDDKILLTGGVARTWANPVVYTDSTVGTSLASLQPGDSRITVNNFHNTGNALQPTQKSFQDTYLGGVLLKPLKNVSVYYSFSTNAAIPGNTPVLWQRGKQHEFGVKSEFFNQRLSISADHFQITQQNFPTVNPAHNIDANAPATILSTGANHGFEFNVVGGVTQNLSVVASYTKMKLRTSVGQRQRNIPDNLANLLLNYHFTEGTLKNFSVFAGIVHVGDVSGENPGGGLAPTPTSPGGAIGKPGFIVAAYTVTNAGATYTWGRYRFNLNVDNVFDQKFWWQPASRQSVTPYPGITVRFATTVRF